MRTNCRRLTGGVLAVALAAAGCGNDETSDVDDQSSADRVVIDPADDPEPVADARADVPPPLESLPREGELDTFDEPDLIGLPLDVVLAWADESGLSNVDVFDSPDKVESSMEFDPARLLLVVEDGIVVDAEFG